MPTITQLAQSQRKQISDADAANLEALARAYSLMYSDLEGDVDSLMLAIEKLDKPSQAEIKALPQYKLGWRASIPVSSSAPELKGRKFTGAMRRRWLLIRP